MSNCVELDSSGLTVYSAKLLTFLRSKGAENAIMIMTLQEVLENASSQPSLGVFGVVSETGEWTAAAFVNGHHPVTIASPCPELSALLDAVIPTVVRNSNHPAEDLNFQATKDIVDELKVYISKRFPSCQVNVLRDMALFVCTPLSYKEVYSQGQTRSASVRDTMLVMNWMKLFNDELDLKHGTAVLEETVRDLIRTRALMVLEDPAGNPVSMAGAKNCGDFSRITSVYTAQVNRKKGYASSLVSQVVKKEISLEGKQGCCLFVLKADEKAVKMYERIGFNYLCDVVAVLASYSS